MINGRFVTLRRVEPRDFDLVQRWQNDPEVHRWMDYDREFSLHDIDESEQRATTEGHPFIIEVNGKPLGRTGLNNIRQRDHIASFYIFIGEKDEWGRGYGLDAVLTVVGWGFETLNLRMIELWSLADNGRAIKTYQAAGFVEDARLPERSLHEGKYVDHMVMSVTPERWRQALETFRGR
ncbi:MAG TPA: GNAT family protein [Actinomycetota bacterium]